MQLTERERTRLNNSSCGTNCGTNGHKKGAPRNRDSPPVSELEHARDVAWYNGDLYSVNGLIAVYFCGLVAQGRQTLVKLGRTCWLESVVTTPSAITLINIRSVGTFVGITNVNQIIVAVMTPAVFVQPEPSATPPDCTIVKEPPAA